MSWPAEARVVADGVRVGWHAPGVRVELDDGGAREAVPARAYRWVECEVLLDSDAARERWRDWAGGMETFAGFPDPLGASGSGRLARIAGGPRAVEWRAEVGAAGRRRWRGRMRVEYTDPEPERYGGRVVLAGPLVGTRLRAANICWLPASWMAAGARADVGTLRMWADGRMLLGLGRSSSSEHGQDLTPEMERRLVVTAVGAAGAVRIHGPTAAGGVVTDATEVYRWTPANHGDVARWYAAERAAAGRDFTFFFEAAA